MRDSIVPIVIAGLVLLFKWLTKSSPDRTEEPPSLPPNKPIQRAPPPTEEERVRRFLEALGVPPGTQPPPPVRPRSVTPRRVVTPTPQAQPPKVRRSWAQPLPPVVATPPDVPPPFLTPAPSPEPAVMMEARRAPAAVVPPPLLTPAAVRGQPSKALPTRVLPMSSLGVALRSRASIRQAIMLREILGPPRGLEPFGQLRGY